MYRWQKLRQAECTLEKELHDQSLDKLATQEREVRKQMEGVVELAARKPSVGTGPLQPYNGDPTPKEASKVQTNGVVKKGKKRKAEN